MASRIFYEWLTKWVKQLEKQNSVAKITLLTEKCLAHPSDYASKCKLKNIKVDQDIKKKIFKVHY